MKIKTYPHWSPNTSRGVMRNPELSACFIKEIKLSLGGGKKKKKKKKEKASNIKRISIWKINNLLSPTLTSLLSIPPNLLGASGDVMVSKLD